MPNHGSPKYLFPSDLSEHERNIAIEWLAGRLAEEAARGPVTCPACDGTDVSGRNGARPTYVCACGHCWQTGVVIFERAT